MDEQGVTTMEIPETLLTMFSAEIEMRAGTPVITLPEQELQLGELEADETYRIAVLTQAGGADDTAPTSQKSGHADRDRQRPHDASEPPVEEGDLCEIEIEDIGEQGDGIARVGPGYIVFVPDTDIGDRVTAEITNTQENFAFAEVVEEEPLSG